MSNKVQKNQQSKVIINNKLQRPKGAVVIGDSFDQIKTSEPQTITQSFSTPVRPGLHPKNK